MHQSCRQVSFTCSIECCELRYLLEMRIISTSRQAASKSTARFDLTVCARTMYDLTAMSVNAKNECLGDSDIRGTIPSLLWGLFIPM